ncbi:phage tail protein [Mesorhizobium sp. M0129]|uniref:phage tail protein n=1 Tax=Mesorhizobium sp. M0129 TaxID=2956886 RepID=UPI003338E786
MVWFATPGSSNVGSSWGGWGSEQTTKQPDPVSAAPSFSFSSVFGRQIPIVVGTYKVDGIPVIGGAATVTNISGYTQVKLTNTQGLGDVGGTGWLNNDPFSRVALVPIQGASQVASMGYLLAYDPFGDGYKLVRLEVNDEVVYDAESGIGASTTFRFYGGNHTAVDPITSKAIGANAGAWQNFAMVYLDGFSATSPPTVKAVISNNATTTPAAGEIVWSGEAPSGLTDAFPHGSAFDPAEGVIYQLLEPTDIPGLSGVWLAVLDVDSRVELYRVPLEGSETYTSDAVDYQLSVPMAMNGSGLVFVHFETLDVPNRLTAVYEAVTGHLLASYIDTVNMFWLTGQQIGQKWVFLGESLDDDPNCMGAVFDPAVGSIDVSNILPAGPSTYVAVRGRVTSGFTSFFSANASLSGDIDIHELRFDGDAWSTVLMASLTGVIDLSVNVLWFDPATGYLVVNYRLAGPINRFKYIDPEDGSVVDTFDANASKSYSNVSALVPIFHDRMISRPGFVAMLETASGNDVVLLDIKGKTFSLFVSDLVAPDGTRLGEIIVDQNNARYMSATGDDAWTVHRQPNTLPGSITVETMLTKVMSLSGYGPSELTFEGLDGLSAYGVGIVSDTNVRTVVQSIADIYGFAFADTGNGYYFKKPGRDASFSLDDALTTADLVFGDSEAVKSEDDADIRAVARVEIEYISKDQGYTSRPASFSLPAITNSIRTERYPSALVLTDLDGQTFVINKFFELQAKRRNHAFSVTGKPAYLPGDVVSVPSGGVTYTVQIDSVATDRSLKADIVALDFQTRVSTTVTPVSSVGQELVAVSLATQYIHLDVPLFRYADDLGGLGLRQYGVLAGRGQANWAGGVLYRGDTASQLSALLTQAPHMGVVGVCAEILATPLDPFALTDDSTVIIRRTAGSMDLLADKTEARVLAGDNFAFIGKQGRWEGVGYKTAIDNGDGTFTLSGFTIRGHRGTEVFASRHQVGDVFVMIKPEWLKSVEQPITDLGTTKFYKAIGIGQDPSTGVVKGSLILGVAETPYACVNLDAVTGSPDGIDLSADYRSRLAAGLNPANHGEAALAFEWDIYAGATYKRTLTSTAASVHYASADVVADQGSDPPTELSFRVFMMSALDILVPGQDRPIAGRGYEARAHVVFDPGDMTADNSIITADSTAYTADAA